MGKDDSQDEIIDGAQAAAEILSRLSSTRRMRLMANIASRAPELASKIEESLIRFEEILELDSRSVQMLLREVDQQDLVHALVGVDEEIVRVVMQALSERRALALQEEIELRADTPHKVREDARKKIAFTLNELLSQGALRRSIEGGLYV